MKILGIAERERYICEVSHCEIEKFLGLYYGKMGRPSIGDDIDLGKGYNYSSEIRDALKKTEDFIKSHESIIKAITDGLTISTREDTP